MPEASAAQTVTLETPGGPMQGQLYVPKSDGKHGAVIVIPEAFGLTPGITIECQRLAEQGYLALGIEIFHRSAPAGWTPSKPDFAEAMPHFRVLTNEGLAEDLAAAKEFLARHPNANGKLGVVGFCVGGFGAYLAACDTGIDAAVVYYGGGIVNERPNLAPLKPLIGKKVNAPILGLFGKDDPSIPESDLEVIDAELAAQDVEHEIIAYEGAGHAFRNASRPSFAPKPAAESWKKALEFLAQKLKLV
jgi:carboxymethylenebutenolidase